MTSIVIQTKPMKEMATYISGTQEIFFDVEPKLPESNCTLEDIHRGRMAQKEIMHREQSNYFASYPQGAIVYENEF